MTVTNEKSQQIFNCLSFIVFFVRERFVMFGLWLIHCLTCVRKLWVLCDNNYKSRLISQEKRNKSSRRQESWKREKEIYSVRKWSLVLFSGQWNFSSGDSVWKGSVHSLECFNSFVNSLSLMTKLVMQLESLSDSFHDTSLFIEASFCQRVNLPFLCFQSHGSRTKETSSLQLYFLICSSSSLDQD